MSMQGTGTGLATRLTSLRVAAAFMAVATTVTGCGDDSEKSDRGAELQAFIVLGPRGLSSEETPPVALATEEAATLGQTLEAGPGDEVHTALTQQPPAGTTGFGFVLAGCEETGAKLNVSDTTITAELTGGENVDCAQAVYFLATFHIRTDQIPEGAVLGGHA